MTFKIRTEKDKILLEFDGIAYTYLNKDEAIQLGNILLTFANPEFKSIKVSEIEEIKNILAINAADASARGLQDACSLSPQRALEIAKALSLLPKAIDALKQVKSECRNTDNTKKECSDARAKINSILSLFKDNQNNNHGKKN